MYSEDDNDKKVVSIFDKKKISLDDGYLPFAEYKKKLLASIDEAYTEDTSMVVLIQTFNEDIFKVISTTPSYNTICGMAELAKKYYAKKFIKEDEEHEEY